MTKSTGSESNGSDSGCGFVLTLAGFDNTAGAGLLSDTKTFQLFGLYGVSIPTAITIQTPDTLLEIARANPRQLRRSCEETLDAFAVSGVKTGLLFDEVIVDAVHTVLKMRFDGKLVVDPVLFASEGKRLLSLQGRQAITKRLFSLASIITPNLEEAQILSSVKIRDQGGLRDAATALLENGPKTVLIKGSGLFGGVDYFFDGSKEHLIEPQTDLAQAPAPIKVHGTGCFHSATVLSLLILGNTALQAVTKAKYLTEKAIQTSVVVEGSKSRLINHAALGPYVAKCLSESPLKS